MRFTVGHRRPLAGAGADRRIVRGTRIELQGSAREHPNGPPAKSVRWQIVDAPRRSRLRRPSHAKGPTKNAPGLKTPTSLNPTFRPDVHGTYTLKMTVGSGAGATTDQVTLHAVPPSPMMEVHTRITSGARAAIQVGNKTYVAPFLSKQGGGTYYGDVDGVGFPDYQALFQVLVFDRSTLEFKANQTWGVCKKDPDRDDIFKDCVMDPKTGEPVIGDLGANLEALGGNPQDPALVVVDSLPAASHDPATIDFVSSQMGKRALDDLSAIGFPDGRDVEDVTASGSPTIQDQLANVPVDSLSVIGSPSLKPGEADWAVIGEAVAPQGRGMNGWFTPDQNVPPHYTFVPGARVPFDTRTQADVCDGQGCTVTAKVGLETLTHKMENGLAGFLAAAYDPHTLERQDLDYFITGSSGSHAAVTADRVAAMAAFLKRWGDAGSLLAVTSIKTPGPDPAFLADPQLNAGLWSGLAQEIAAIGGTYHGFNTAASAANSDYTLIGFSGAAEGEGEEVFGDKARLQGVLVQDHESLYRPANVVAFPPAGSAGNAADADAPSEFLTGLVMTPPGKKPWPLSGDAGAQSAFSYIGAQYPELTSDPRTAYWSNGLDEKDAARLAGQVGTLGYPSPLTYYLATHAGQPPPPALPLKVPFTAADFGNAQRQLVIELNYVSNARSYLDKLAAPYGAAGGAAWGDAKTLADTLKTTLDTLKAEEERTLQIIDMVAAFFDFASLPWSGEDGEVIEKILYSTSASMEFGHELVETTQDGSSAGDEDDELLIAVDDVGQQLQERMQHLSDSFGAIGDIVVSDWYKLELVGKYGNCDLPGGGCVCNLEGGCPPGLDQLATSTPTLATVGAATEIALQRMAHEEIVPYYFPIMDTGVSYCIGALACAPNAGPDIHNFTCPLEPNPLGSAPAGAWGGALEVFDPVGGRNRWRTYVAAAKVGSNYTWPDESILTRMFTDVNVDQLSADPPVGLGIPAIDWMREAHASDPNPVNGAYGCNWPEPF